MAREIRRFAAVVNTGSTPTAPQTISLAFPPRTVEEIEVRIPPGPRGEVGFALGFGGIQVIPFQSGQYIVGNDEVVRYQVTGYPNSGAWQLLAYNTGQFAHTLEVRFLLQLNTDNASQQAVPIDASAISSVPDQGATQLPVASLPPPPQLPAPPELPPAPAPIPVPAPPPAPPAVPSSLPVAPGTSTIATTPTGGYDVLSPGLKVGLSHITFYALYQRGPTQQELFDLANSMNADGSNFGDLVQGLTANITNAELNRLRPAVLADRVDQLAAGR